MATLNLEQTVVKAVARDHAAFECLYEHLIDRIYAFVRFRTNDKENAIDITQDVFVDLYSALEGFTYKTEGQFYAFVFMITKRKLARYYAGAKTESTKRADVFDEALLAAQGEDTETKDAITRALATLPEVTSEIIILHHWSRYTFSEIAELLGMNESAVRVRHHRALEHLAELL